MAGGLTSLRAAAMMSDMTSTTITLTETEKPSRSKGYGWARIGDRGATAAGREIAAKIGADLVVDLVAKIKRSTRTETLTERVTVTVTGDPSDAVSLSIGSPQPYRATITGVVVATAHTWTADDFAGATSVSFGEAYAVRETLRAAGATWSAYDQTWTYQVDDAEVAARLATAVEAVGGTIEIY